MLFQYIHLYAFMSCLNAQVGPHHISIKIYVLCFSFNFIYREYCGKRWMEGRKKC